MDKWTTIEEAAQSVYVGPSLIERWVKEGRVAVKKDERTQALLVSADDVEEAAEEEAFRLLSADAIAQEEER